jgi:LuxR family transcriptional regulator, maltose regulon positive regulatory protein
VSEPLLETKLHPPRNTGGLVRRPRLGAFLGREHQPAVVVVSAPAGFGKSTMLADALASVEAPRSVAWLSLDPRDSDATTYWTYVVAAIRRVRPEVGDAALALLDPGRPAPITTVLTALINELGALDGGVLLVLDDYHVIESPDIHEAMAFLIEHLPEQLRVVIVGRSDPPLPLARLRSRGELAEVRAADLRFTADEVATYLETMGLRLTEPDLGRLEQRTEGWIAALQLAALSMRGRDDVSGFIAGFAGDDRYVVDYLVEEVMQRQPEDVRAFLLQTSILDRLTGPLCDAVTGQEGGRATLEALDRGNMFVVALDDHRRWYRYHHLFADMLRARLLDEHPDEVPELHRRASTWHAANGDSLAAVEHALAAGDTDRAADLVELAAPTMRRERREGTLRRWMESLPEGVFANRPVLSVNYVGALMGTGDFRGVEPLLESAEQWVEAGRAIGDLPDGMVVMEPSEYRRLPGWIAVYRTGQALLRGDVAATMTLGHHARGLLAPDDHLGHGAAAGLMGIASWSQADLASAEEAYAESMRRLAQAGFYADVLGLSVTLADIQLVQGRLGHAQQTFDDGLRLADRQPGSVLRGTPDMHVGLSTIHWERGDLATAREHLRRARELGEALGMPQYPHRSRIALAQVLADEGDLDAAESLLGEAEQVYDGDFSPDVRPVPAMRARMWIRQGRADRALDWARKRGLSADDELGYLREYEHVTLARALLAGAEEGEATALLERLLVAAGTGGRGGSVLEVLVLQALDGQQRGDLTATLAPLERALSMAEPEGYVRLFTDEGPPMTAALRAAAQRRIAPSFVARLLGTEPVTGKAAATGALLEPLSRRELEVLRLLATELSGPEIARELVVSLNTVRTHTKNVYAKLGVGTRRAAVRRADELGLLSRSSGR